MAQAFDLSGHRVAPGTRALIQFPVARRASGETLQIAVHVVHGSHDGPALGLTSTSHGDEAFTVEAIRRIVTQTDPGTLRGTIVAVPVLNPVAFESYTRATGQGMNTDDNNMNRVFPGDAHGWLTQQMAAAVSTNVVPFLTNLLDFHTGGLDTGIDYVLTELPDGPAGDKTLALSRAFGSELLFVSRRGVFGEQTLTGLARSKSIVCTTPMVGGHGLGEVYHEKAVRGIRNVMIHLGMIDGTVVRPKRQRTVSRRVLLGVKNGGLFYPEIGYDALGTTVRGGTVMGRVVDPHTFEELESIKAPYDGSIMIMMRGVLSRVNPGDYGYIIGDEASATVLD
jgi:predicted deacylase